MRKKKYTVETGQKKGRNPKKTVGVKLIQDLKHKWRREKTEKRKKEKL